MSAALPRRWRRMRHRLRRLGQISAPERRLLVEATLGLIAARVALRTMPFPRIARRLGGFVTPQQALAKQPLPTARDRELARAIGWAVTRAALHVPFAAVCLPQAMAAHAMLRRRGVSSVLHFGTARGARPSLDAHAWLDVGGVEVTGYPIRVDLTEIACIAETPDAGTGTSGSDGA